MPERQKEYVFSRPQLEQALAVLENERRAYPFSSTQRKLYNWFRISFWIFWISFSAFLILTAIAGAAPPEFGLRMVVFIVATLSFVSLMLSVPLNWRFFWQTLRQFNLARRVKLWHVRPRWSRTGRLFRWVVRFILVVVLLTLTLSVIRIARAEPVTASISLFLILTVVFYWFISYARKRLDVLATLEPLLQREVASTDSGAESISIPADAVTKIGDIEEQQIQRRRAEAIKVARHENAGYAVLRSRAIVAGADRLDPTTQLRVEARVADLARDPQPADAKPEGGAGGVGGAGGADEVWSVPAPGTSLEILYTVDRGARRVLVHALRGALHQVGDSGTAEAVSG
jgi:hypothetical protein